MFPITSSTETPLDCIATAIKLLIEATKIDVKCASIVPKFAVAFANMAKDPRAKTRIDSVTAPSVINSEPPPTATTYLVESIRVMSLSAPLFVTQSSELILLIVGVMSPAQSTGFASAEAGAETRLVSVGQDAALPSHESKVSKPNNADNVDSPLAPEGTNVLESDDRKMAAKSCESSRDKPSPEYNRSDSSWHAVLEDAEVLQSPESSESGLSNKVMRSSYYGDEKDGPGKRKGNEESRNPISNRIPKRPKIQAAHLVFSLPKAPNSDGGITYQSSSFYQKKPPFLDHPFAFSIATEDERNLAMSRSRDNIPMSVLLHRVKLWNQVLEYKPSTPCIPTDTLLIIVITCAGNDDNPPLLKKYIDHENCDKAMKSFLSIKKILLIPRPLGATTMYYCIANLHQWQHGTLHLKSQQESWFKETTKHIADLEVIQPGKSYRNKDLGIDICYKDPGWGTSPLRQLLPYIALDMDTSSSTVRKVPCLSCGWSTANPNEYKNNRSNILGSISPFVSVGGIKYLEEKHKKDVVDLVCHVIEFFSPCGIHPTPFFHSDPNIRMMRKDLSVKLLEAIGVKSKELYEKFFLREGIAFIFNNFVPFHVDGMNDPASGMNETLAMNCQCLIDVKLSQIPSVKKAMAFFNLKVGDPLSFSIVLYSRKVVGDYVKKQLKIKTILDAADNVVNPHLPDCWWLLKPILTAIEQVDSKANTNALWDDQSLLEKYASESRCDADSDEYTGHYISLRSGYDRMRYWSCVKYLFDTIEAQRIFHWNREHAMGFICFVTLEGCSAFLLGGIIDECLCSTSPKLTALIQDANKYGMYCHGRLSIGEKGKKN